MVSGVINQGGVTKASIVHKTTVSGRVRQGSTSGGGTNTITTVSTTSASEEEISDYGIKTVSVYGTLEDFLRAFANALTSADARITCNIDLDDGIPYDADFYFGEAFRVYITPLISKRDGNRTGGYDYTIRTYNIYNKSAFYLGLEFRFSGEKYFFDENATRTWKYRLIANSEILVLELMPYNTDTPYVKFGLINRNNSFVFACWSSNWGSGTSPYFDYTVSNIIKRGFAVDVNTSVRKIDMLPYTYDTQTLTNIQVLNGKIFALNGNKSFKLNKLIDCTNVTPDTWLKIDNKLFYALDEHTLMEVNT